jgi:hypothetical protein
MTKMLAMSRQVWKGDMAHLKSGTIMSYWSASGLQHSVVVTGRGEGRGKNNKATFGVEDGEVDLEQDEVEDEDKKQPGWVEGGLQWKNLYGELVVVKAVSAAEVLLPD